MYQLQSLELYIDRAIALKLIKKHDLMDEYDWMKEHDEFKKKFEPAIRAMKEQL
jgi:hypothetical protein